MFVFGLRGAMVLVVGACWTSPVPPTAPVANTQPGGVRDPTGAYWCTIESDGTQYDRFPCVIRKQGGQLVLAKLGGSQRFTGVVKPVGGGLAFDGQFYCPWGDCTEPMRGTFAASGRGLVYRGDHFNVHMVHAPDSAFGGVSYGGDGYGGDEYGVQFKAIGAFGGP